MNIIQNFRKIKINFIELIKFKFGFDLTRLKMLLYVRVLLLFLCDNYREREDREEYQISIEDFNLHVYVTGFVHTSLLPGPYGWFSFHRIFFMLTDYAEKSVSWNLICI